MVIQERRAGADAFGGIGMPPRLAHSRPIQEIEARSNFHRGRPDTNFDSKTSFADWRWLSSDAVPERVAWKAPNPSLAIFHAPQRAIPTDSAENGGNSGLVADLRRRLNNANRHFRRKAAAVFNDDAALTLLATLYESVVVETEDFDFCEHGQALAKLTAANFAEVGANGIFITEPGQRFIDNINAP